MEELVINKQSDVHIVNSKKDNVNSMNMELVGEIINTVEDDFMQNGARGDNTNKLKIIKIDQTQY